jgi:hypothetical protein
MLTADASTATPIRFIVEGDLLARSFLIVRFIASSGADLH